MHYKARVTTAVNLTQKLHSRIIIVRLLSRQSVPLSQERRSSSHIQTSVRQKGADTVEEKYSGTRSFSLFSCQLNFCLVLIDLLDFCCFPTSNSGLAGIHLRCVPQKRVLRSLLSSKRRIAWANLSFGVTLESFFWCDCKGYRLQIYSQFHTKQKSSRLLILIL